MINQILLLKINDFIKREKLVRTFSKLGLFLFQLLEFLLFLLFPEPVLLREREVLLSDFLEDLQLNPVLRDQLKSLGKPCHFHSVLRL